MPLDFNFYHGGFENSAAPCIVRESPTGGDPHIIATIARVYNPEALYELCSLANSAKQTSSLEGS